MVNNFSGMWGQFFILFTYSIPVVRLFFSVRLESSVDIDQMSSSETPVDLQHAHSYFCLGVHVPPSVSIWGYMFIFEGTHILELFFHSKRIEAMKSDHLDVYNSDIIML